MVVDELSDLAFMAGTEDTCDMLGGRRWIEMEGEEIVGIMGRRGQVRKRGTYQGAGSRCAKKSHVVGN